MGVTSKKRLYNKALRILYREINRLDKKSKEAELSSEDRTDLVRLLKPLEADIKEDKKPKKTLSPADLRRAEEILRQLHETQGSGQAASVESEGD